ncbi:hypothetical protein [Shewanella donghaensis]|uniref:hypothetical protein n=1 Tax=Shewanella donghaensis TaxID=238836 RepID=UPI0011842A03|nr:hypothetical protein [Shewanella donghaensis]
MMKNWIMSVLGQQSSQKRKKVEFDLRFETQSFKPGQDSVSADDDSLLTIVDDNKSTSQFKPPNSK